MFKKINSIALLLITMGFIQSSLAFSDLSESDWFYPYVIQLKQKGVFDESDQFNPNEEISRGEFTKIMIQTKGNISVENLSSESFKDVPKDSKYFTFIEAAHREKIINGYRDQSGNLTGVFGVSDKINRAAATKILIEAFQIPLKKEVEASFKDVPKETWYYDYIANAYFYKIIEGYSKDQFGPADYLTRAQVAKMAVLANQVAQNKGENNKQTTEDLTSPSEESFLLKVGLIKPEGSSTVIPLGSSVKLIEVELEASSQPIQINQFTLTRTGVGNANDWRAIYSRQNELKISSEHTINQDSNQVKLPVDLKIEPYQKTIIAFYGEVQVNASPLGQHQFSLTSIDYEASNEALNESSGTAGPQVSIGSANANTLIISNGSLPARPISGKLSEIGTFKLKAGNDSDVQFKSASFKINGSINQEEIENCELKYNNQKLAERSMPHSESIHFKLNEPFNIPRSADRSFSVQCYLNPTAYQEDIRVYLDETYDLQAIDLNFGYSPKVINEYSDSDSPTLNIR